MVFVLINFSFAASWIDKNKCKIITEKKLCPRILAGKQHKKNNQETQFKKNFFEKKCSFLLKNHFPSIILLN